MRVIKAKILNKEIITEIPSIQYEFLEDDLVEVFVSAKSSDKVLTILLERGCSIIELTEKR